MYVQVYKSVNLCTHALETYYCFSLASQKVLRLMNPWVSKSPVFPLCILQLNTDIITSPPV